MSYAKIYLKGGTEKTLILNVRTALLQGFEAPNWTDLRCGWLVSLTQAAADDTIITLTETIGTEPRPFLPWSDRFAIGLTDKATRNTFLGYTNNGPLRPSPSVGSSKLISSDAGVGTTNANFWRPKNEIDDKYNVQIHDGNIVRARNNAVLQPHFVQNTGGAGGYATLIAIRYRRDAPRSKVIRMEVKQGTNASDILFTNAPTADLLKTNLESFPTTVQQIGPVELGVEPDAF